MQIKTLCRSLSFLALLLLFSHCQPDQMESKIPDTSSEIQDRTDQLSLPLKYGYALDENEIVVGEGTYEPENPEFEVNCDGPFQWHCCYLKLYHPSQVPSGPVQVSGTLFGFAARTCDPNYTLWLKAERYQPPTPPAIIGSFVTFWEWEGKSWLDPCWSNKAHFLSWVNQLPSGKYNISAEIRTGGQTWIPPNPIKPWIGGYWEYNYCARESLLNVVIP